MYYISKGSLSASLIPSNAHSLGNIARSVFFSDKMDNFLAATIEDYAKMGERLVLSRDATYKVLNSLIGQNRHGKGAATDGELHTRHTLRGMTGAMPGVSLKYSESGRNSISAMQEILPLTARASCLFLFTDNPRSLQELAKEGSIAAKETFPNLKALREDPLHLALRVENCLGCRRNRRSSDVLKLQLKFCSGMKPKHVFFRSNANPRKQTSWEAASASEEDAKRLAIALENDEYLLTPFNSHAEYVRALACVAILHAKSMGSRDSKGRSVLSALKAGARYEHFGYLQNGALCLSLLGKEKLNLLPVGTASNEALRAELRIWAERVTTQHEERLLLVLRIFTIMKLLAHSSAAKFPTTQQLNQSLLTHIIAGHIASGLGSPSSDVATAAAKNRYDMRNPRAPHNIQTADAAKVRHAVRKERPGRQKEAAAASGRRVVKSQRKRTAFTLPRKSSDASDLRRRRSTFQSARPPTKVTEQRAAGREKSNRRRTNLATKRTCVRRKEELKKHKREKK